jgi:hypothetical protein
VLSLAGDERGQPGVDFAVELRGGFPAEVGVHRAGDRPCQVGFRGGFLFGECPLGLQPVSDEGPQWALRGIGPASAS